MIFIFIALENLCFFQCLHQNDFSTMNGQKGEKYLLTIFAIMLI